MRRATVVTVAGGKVTDLLNNFIINHARLHVAFPLLVHCLDENVLTACRTFAASVHSQQVLCLRARCCTAADGATAVPQRRHAGGSRSEIGGCGGGGTRCWAAGGPCRDERCVPAFLLASLLASLAC